ncbi:MAG: DUF4197 domain-containing protein [Gammaproteobacteria bacterium]|nr:DUF4197 domain-containing protein [Gammaproteobacteria bacterium]
MNQPAISVHASLRGALYFITLLLLVSISSSCVKVDKAVSRYQELSKSGKLDSKTVVAGLKEALKVGTERTVLSTSAVDGYLGDALIRIAMPSEFQKMGKALRKVGLGRYVDEMEVAMNRAAEQAATEARDVFWQAISSMTLDDAFSILKGDDSAATRYFRSRTEPSLRRRYQPIVGEKMKSVGLYQSYNRAVEAYMKIPFVKKPTLDLNSYVTDGALDGLFNVLAQEEKKIRIDPAARSTELLKRVFAEQ